MRFGLKSLGVPVLLFLAVLLAIWQPVRGRAVGPEYRTAVVERGDLTVGVSAAGTLNAVILVEVGSQISGQIKEIFVDFNSPVERGQLIARIDPDIFQAKVAAAKAEGENSAATVLNQRANVERLTADLESARGDAASAAATVHRMHAEVESARATIASARAGTARETATADNTRRELDRRSELLDKGLIARRDKDDAQTAFSTAQAQLDGARSQERAGEASLNSARAQVVATESQARAAAARIRSAEAGLQAAQAQLVAAEAGARQKRAALQQARIDLRNTEIRAPVSGVVISRNVNVGQTVAASLQAPTLFTIAQDLRHMQVEATVVEADVSRFAPGQPVTFTVDAQGGRIFTGKVAQVRKAPKPRENIVTYVVVVTVDDPADALLPGMTANLQVVTARRTDVLKVPNAALRFRPADEAALPAAATGHGRPDGPGGLGRVFVVGPNGQPTPVAVRLGVTDGRMSEVLAGGLAAGQPVITGEGTPAASRERGLLSFRLR